MYNKFYGLEESPFNLTPDSRYLYLSHRHKEALAALIYGINERKGFICLTGEIGSGKTTVCRSLVNELPKNTRIALVLNSFLTEIELLKYINEEFGLNSDYDSKKGLIDELNIFLLKERSQNNNVLLIIDEAQNLGVNVLEQIRMLSNLETETDKLLQIVLIGQPELLETLNLSELEQLNQRITVRYHISPLSEEETLHYIKHRLFVARCKIEIDFTPKAIKSIYNITKGVPRKLNVLCDQILLIGYVQSTYTIDEKIVKKAMEEVEGKIILSEKKKNGKDTQSSAQSNLVIKLLLALCVILFLGIIGIMIINQKYTTKFVAEEFLKQNQPKPQPRPAPVSTKPTDSASTDTKVLTTNTNASSTQTLVKADDKATTDTSKIAEKPKPKPIQYNWEMKNGVVRISNPEFAYQASSITLLSSLWNIKIDLEPFKDASEIKIRRKDILGDASNLGFKKFDVSGSIMDVFKCNAPAILEMKNNQNFSPYIVLTSVQGEALTIADPINGLKIVKKKEIENNWNGNAVVVYYDKLNLVEITKGEESERVKFLQEFLAKNKYYKATVDGIYSSQTIDAVKGFQRFNQLEPTGEIDIRTALFVSIKATEGAPNLFNQSIGE